MELDKPTTQTAMGGPMRLFKGTATARIPARYSCGEILGMLQHEWQAHKRSGHGADIEPFVTAQSSLPHAIIEVEPIYITDCAVPPCVGLGHGAVNSESRKLDAADEE